MSDQSARPDPDVPPAPVSTALDLAILSGRAVADLHDIAEQYDAATTDDARWLLHGQCAGRLSLLRDQISQLATAVAMEIRQETSKGNG